MKVIKVFVASSNELKSERKVMAEIANTLNTVFEKHGVIVISVEWENLDSSMTSQFKQEEYNQKLCECEMCIALFWTKLGLYTQSEFDTAYNELCAGNNPKKLYVYFKQAEAVSPELAEFRDSFPKRYGHFYNNFANIDTLKTEFLIQFIEYQSHELATKNLYEIKDGLVLLDGKKYVELKNVPFAGNNEEYNSLKENITDLKEWLEEHESNHPMYSEKAQRLLKKQEKLQKMENSLWETAMLITRLSTSRCSERLQRAMELFNQGDNKGANAILNEEEIERDVIRNMNLIDLGREGLSTNIEEYELKIKTYENEMPDGWCEQVLGLRKKIIEICRHLYGETTKETAEAYWKLADTYYIYDRFAESLEFQKKALEIRRHIFGEMHLATAQSYNDTACCLYHIEDYKSERDCLEKALDIRLQLLGENHNDTAETYLNLGMLLQVEKKLLEAKKCFQKVLDIEKGLCYNLSENSAVAYSCIGGMHFLNRQFIEALEFRKKALDTYISIRGEIHIETSRAYMLVGEIYLGIDYKKAQDYLQKSLDISLRIMGKDHPLVRECNQYLSFIHS